MPTIAAMDLWTCPLGEHPVTRTVPQESPLFLPLPETQSASENAPVRGNMPPEEECLVPETAMGRLYCYLFHAGVISNRPTPSCSVQLPHSALLLPQRVQKRRLHIPLT